MASYVNLMEEYNALETRIHRALRMLIDESPIQSKHVDSKALKVNIFDYAELVLIDDKLTFLHNHGYHRSIDFECTLIDLIDIINQNK